MLKQKQGSSRGFAMKAVQEELEAKGGETLLIPGGSGSFGQMAVPIAKALLAGGADVNLRDQGGKTPLLLAAREGQNDMVAFLIENGADVNLVSNSQRSALYYATENGFTEIVEQLLMAGAEG